MRQRFVAALKRIRMYAACARVPQSGRHAPRDERAGQHLTIRKPAEFDARPGRRARLITRSVMATLRGASAGSRCQPTVTASA